MVGKRERPRTAQRQRLRWRKGVERQIIGTDRTAGKRVQRTLNSNKETTMRKQWNAHLKVMEMTTRCKRHAVVVLGVMALAVASAAAQTEFKYLGSNGPAFWGQLDPAWTAC